MSASERSNQIRPGCHCFIWDEDCPEFKIEAQAIEALARSIASMIGRNFDTLADSDKELMMKSARETLEK